MAKPTKEEIKKFCEGYNYGIDQFLLHIKSKQQTMYLQRYVDLRDIEDIAEYLKEDRYDC